MAEINTPAAGGGKAGVRKSKKLSTRVDLTPMVDLGFLLITFFIFTTTMSDPAAMKLVMPKDTTVDGGPNVGESAALTAIPLAGHKAFYYHGNLTDALSTNQYGITDYSMSGLGQVVRDKQITLDKMGAGKRKDLTLMIKPTPESDMQDLVNVLDEVLINDVKHYAIMEIMPEEEKAVVEKSKEVK